MKKIRRWVASGAAAVAFAVALACVPQAALAEEAFDDDAAAAESVVVEEGSADSPVASDADAASGESLDSATEGVSSKAGEDSADEDAAAVDPVAEPDVAAGSEAVADEAAEPDAAAEPADVADSASDPELDSDPDSEPAAEDEPLALAVQGGDATPAASISYRTHVQKDGWQAYVSDGAMSGTSGRSLRLEGINIRIDSELEGGVQYQVHVQHDGWQAVKADDAMAGTSGRSLRLEAIRIMLTGELSKYYDVTYRTHVQRLGWQGWVSNGAMSGTSGLGYRLEGIEIKLVKKPTVQAQESDGIVAVRYRGHVQSVGWQPYVMDGDMAGTSGRSLRVEAANIALDKGLYSGGITYRAHVQSIGWQDWKSNGAMAGTSGRALRMEAFQIKLTGDIANAFDVVYRTHVQGIGWQNWTLNGGTAGTSGQSKRVEALQIRLVKKGTDQVISEGTYFFGSAANTALAADDPGASAKSGTQMRAYTANYTNAQRFYVRSEGQGTYSIQSVASGLFLADNGGKVVQVADSTAKANRWKATWNGGYALVNAATGKEIALSGGKAASGTLLATQAAAQKPVQRWLLTSTSLIGAGTYTLANARSGNMLDVSGSSWENGANIDVAKANGGGSQAFTLKDAGSDVYTIVNAMNGKAVEVKGASSANGANVQQNAASSAKAQRWKASIDRSGNITFTNQASGKVLAAAGAASGANANQQASSGATLQKWKLTETTYKPDPVLQRALNYANSNGSSTSYYIAVDLTNHRTIIFQGKKGGWKPVKNWVCSTGAPVSPTVLGNYTITGYRMYSFGHGYTCYYATQFWGDYLFHSVLYNEGTFTVQDGRLGQSVSQGCVRLDINNAKWIYNNIPAGTFVKTYY